jgi:hypothetical protein
MDNNKDPKPSDDQSCQNNQAGQNLPPLSTGKLITKNRYNVSKFFGSFNQKN